MSLRSPALLRRLSYWGPIGRAVNALHLRRMARRAYYYLARPPGGVLTVAVGTATAGLYVRSLEELRTFETDVFKEQHIMERLILTLKPGDVVYDVGANVGLYALLLAKVVGERGQVIAFEPVREYYGRLLENVTLNGTTQVRSFERALGDYSGELRISAGGALGHQAGAGDDPSGDGYRTVTVVEGDRLREEAKLPLPTVVKIDVEGAEYGVLRGLRETLARPDCTVIMCEVHPQLLPAEVSPELIFDLATSLGFTQVERYPCEGRPEFHAILRKPFVPGA